MSKAPKFVPRDLLEVPGFFGEQEDVMWRLAGTVDEAVRLARAREQHELAYVIYRRRRRHDLSVAEVAARLEVPGADLRRKLGGYLPAQHEDVIRWCWYLDEPRRSYRPEDLLATPTAVLLPRLET